MLVIGCGMSGLMNVKLAWTKGCKIIAADINKTKLEIARRMGADMVINAADNIAES